MCKLHPVVLFAVIATFLASIPAQALTVVVHRRHHWHHHHRHHHRHHHPHHRVFIVR